MNVTGCRPLWSSRFLFFFRPRVLQVPTRLERERNKELIRVGQKKQEEEEEEEEKEESERIEKKKKRKGQPPFVGCDRGLRRAMQLATQLSPGQIKLPVHRAIVLALSLTLFVVFVASSSFLPSFLSSSSSSPPIPRSLSALVSLLVTHTHTHTQMSFNLIFCCRWSHRTSALSFSLILHSTIRSFLFFHRTILFICKKKRTFRKEQLKRKTKFLYFYFFCSLIFELENKNRKQSNQKY